MKRALMASSVASVLLLASCGGGGETADVETTPSTAATATAGAEAAAGGGSDRMAVNDEVRAACQEVVAEKLAGAEFTTRAILRAASTQGGKLYTVSGTAQAGGTGHPYTCEVTVTADGLSLGAVTVDGQ